jgi:hypothetical protein
VDAFIAARAVRLVNFVLQDPNPNWEAEASAFVAKVEHLPAVPVRPVWRLDPSTGVVFLSLHWKEASANVLTHDFGLNPLAKIPEYKVSAVQLENPSRQEWAYSNHRRDRRAEPPPDALRVFHEDPPDQSS